jgi:hypothetical protein
MLHRTAFEDGTDSVPKRRLLALRRRGNTQKKTYYNYYWYIITVSVLQNKILQTFKQNYSEAHILSINAEILSQNITLLFPNKSATCFGYCQQPLSG